MDKKAVNRTAKPDWEGSQAAAEKTTDTPLLRVMALHALEYCERLFYLEEVEEIRRADARVYQGRRLHHGLDKGPENFQMELSSEKLGLRGKADCIRKNSGELVVFEHKKGRSRDGKDAWPGDRLQVLAYGLLVEEATGQSVKEVRVRYHADNRTVIFPFEKSEALSVVQEAVERANRIRESLDRPPVAVSDRLCRNCSLAPVCLPEEERFAVDPERKPRRLFPPDDDRRVVHLVEQGARIGKTGEQLVVYSPEGDKKALPGKQLSSLVLHGNIQVSTQAIHFCAANDIGVHWLSYSGHYVGALSQGAGAVQRKNRQFKAFADPAFRLPMVVRIAKAKVENQLRYLLRLTRAGKRTPEIEEGISGIRKEIRSLGKWEKALEDGPQPSEENAQGVTGNGESDSRPPGGIVRGHEGRAGRLYFKTLALALNKPSEDLLFFSERNRRPPKDPFNALLSFGYSLLYKDTVAAIASVGLEPALGLFHTPRSAAYPLALDLMELFRVLLWDMPMVASVNRNQWNETDFAITKRQVWLSESGKRKAIQIYELRKQEKWKHPVLDYSLSYSRAMELEARLLEKEYGGSPGLFAKLRLR